MPSFAPRLRAAVLCARFLLLLCAAVTLASAVAHAQCSSAPTRDVMFGTAISTAYFNGRVTGAPRARYLAEIQRDFRMVTLENAGKMWSYRPSRDGYSWGDIDAIVAWARAHGIALKFHALLYDLPDKRPQWYRALSPDERYRALEEHVRTTVRRYAGDFVAWDVANEPLTSSESDYFGTGRPRLEVIANAFKWARAEDKRGLLVLNEQVPVGDDDKAESLIALANALEAYGAPVQAIGLQSHYLDGTVPPAKDIVGFIRHLSCATHLPVQVTEFDVASTGKSDWPMVQAKLYRRAIGAFIAAGVDRITLWGFYDGAHWKPGAGLFDDSFAPKPAYFALADLLRAGRRRSVK